MQGITFEDRTLSFLAHFTLVSIAITEGVFFPLTLGFSTILILLKPNLSEFLKTNFKESFNAWINLSLLILIQTIVNLISVATFLQRFSQSTMIGIGWITFIMIIIYKLFACYAIFAAIMANKGRIIRYPIPFRFIQD